MRFFVKILTPTAELLRDYVDSVRLPAVDGMYELLPNHAPIFVALHAGDVSILQAGETERWFIERGSCYMADNQCTVMIHDVLDVSSIDKQTLIHTLKNEGESLSSTRRQLLEAQLAYIQSR